MLDQFFELLAARKNPRFRAFIEGKKAYESFTAELRVRFDQMSEEDYHRARNDPRMTLAAQSFATAIKLSEDENALADAGVARYQLGLVLHARGELEESGELFGLALKIMANLPRRDATDMSACHYHLGIIAQKQGRLEEAVLELRRSKQMDEAAGDFAGAKACDQALAVCANLGADIDAEVHLLESEAGTWQVPKGVEEPIAEDETETMSDFRKTDRVRSNRPQLIWLASYSVQANDLMMTHLDSLSEEFGRPVVVSRVAFGADSPDRRSLSSSEADRHLCAAILVLERKGLEDEQFQALAYSCMRRVIDMPDFRLLVYLHDLTADDLREMSDDNPMVATMFDTTQIAELPSLEQLRRTLVPYIRTVEQLRTAANWRTIRLRMAKWCGILANIFLLVVAVFGLLGIPAWFLEIDLDWLGSYGSSLSSLAVGILAFPLQSPLIFLILRGMRTMFMARENLSLMTWWTGGMMVMFAASRLQTSLQGPYSWLFLGVAIGILLDAVRRAGRRAGREMLDLETLLQMATDPALKDPQLTVLRGNPLNLFSYPLFPVWSARVFISYTRSSANISRLAVMFHNKLKEAGVSPFLDRANIPAGASWRRSLNENLGRCDTFICILDERGVQREWVAAELLAALEARQIAGAPDIFIVLDPALRETKQDLLPIFEGVLAAAGESPVQGRPQILQLNEQTLSSLVWGLSPGRFVSPSIFPRVVALPFLIVMALLSGIGGFGIIAGYILGFLVILDRWGKVPVVTWLAENALLEPLILPIAFWLGFTARASISWGIERNKGREIGFTAPALATAGLFWAALALVPGASVYVIAWSGVLAVTGWMLVSYSIQMDGKSQGNEAS